MSRNFTDGRLQFYENIMRQTPRYTARADSLRDLACKYCVRFKPKGKCEKCPYTKIIFDAMQAEGVQSYSNRYGLFLLAGRVVTPREG